MTINYRYFMKGAVCALFERDEKYLVMKRKNTGYFDGYYAIPGGKLDPGETMVEGAFREAHEELGIPDFRVNPTPHATVHILAYHAGDAKSKTTLFSMTRTFLQNDVDISNSEPEKCEELLWLSADEILKMSSEVFIPIHRFAFQKLVDIPMGQIEFYNFPHYPGAY